MVEIYTDASVSGGKAVTTCFVLTKSNFIGHNVCDFQGIETSLQGELEGAIAAIEFAAENLNMKCAILYSDSISLIRLAKTNLDKTKNKQALLHKERLLYLQALIKRYFIKMELVKGHSKGHNPNKVVDLISNSVLRYSKEGD